MLFKNAVMYRFSGPLDVSGLNESLNKKAFVECRPLDASSTGFVPPAKHSGQLAYVLDDFILLCVKQQQKTVSKKAVAQLVAQKVEVLEKEQGRKVFKQERIALKQKIETDALPNVLPVSDLIYAVICTRTGQLIIDTASIKKAEQFTSLLRYVLGSLPIAPYQTMTSPGAAMRNWLHIGEPEGLFFADSVSLYDDAEKSRANLKNVRVDGQAVSEHLSDGLAVSQMALFHEEGLTITKFLLTDQLTFKAIRIGTLEAVDVEDGALQFETDLFLAVHAVLSAQAAVFKALGGVEGDSVLPTGIDVLKSGY